MEIRPDSEETIGLLTRIDHDNRAFDQLFARYRSMLRRVVDLRFDPSLRSRIDPSDVVQETQLEAFRRLSDYLNRRPMPFHL